MTYNLPVLVEGKHLISDLSVSIRPAINVSYENINAVKKLIPIKLKDNKEEWRRHVEITFNSFAYNYYFFSGNNKAYRERREEHWIVEVEGYSFSKNIPGGIKSNSIKKHTFNLNRYNSIDEVIRDMVNRVTIYTRNAM